MLTVGAARLRLGWLFAAVALGFFSGIAAIFLLVPIVARLAVGDGRMSWLLDAVDLFGWCSGIFAIFVAAKRHRVLAQPRVRQRWFALAVWFVHLIALRLFFLIGLRHA